MNFIKLNGDLQLTLWSLGQFSLTNINFSKTIDCNLHLKFVKILAKEKILLVSI